MHTCMNAIAMLQKQVLPSQASLTKADFATMEFQEEAAVEQTWYTKVPLSHSLDKLAISVAREKLGGLE